MSNTAIMTACTIALVCIEIAQDMGIIQFTTAFFAAAIAFAILGRTIRKKIENRR